MTSQLADLPIHRVDWAFDAVDDGVGRWIAFVEAQGVEVRPPDDLPSLIKTMRARVAGGMSFSMARDIVLQRLAVVTNGAMKAAARDERMRRVLLGGGEADDGCPRWALLSDSRRGEIEAAGHMRFAVPPGKALLLNLTTLPLAAAILYLGYLGFDQSRWDLLAATAVLYTVWLLGRRAIRARLGS